MTQSFALLFPDFTGQGLNRLRNMKLGRSLACFVILFACKTELTLAQQGFRLERFEEDHSKVFQEDGTDSTYRRLKHIQLGDQNYVSLGGEIRERVDTYDAPSFGIGTSKDTYDLQRLLLHADAHFGDRTRLFVQLGRHSQYGKVQSGPSDTDGADIQNAFLDFIPDPEKRLTLRIGRQDIFLNSAQRFVSVREGPNMRQSFDGVSVGWVDSSVRIKAFLTRPIRYKPGTFDDASDNRQRFFGADISYAFDAANTLEAYALELDRDRVNFGSAQADERRRSVAVRWAGNDDNVDHDVEAIYQYGIFGDKDIRAWALSLGAGYTFRQKLTPRLGIEIDAGSGDRNPKDGNLETFNPLFPRGPFFDPSSLNSWANLLLVRASFSIIPTNSMNLSFSVGERWRQSTSDAVYTQPYIPLAATLGNRERRVGEQYEFNMTWQANRHLVILAQALHATAGPAILLAGGRSVNYAMLTAQFRF
jgi:hypothetical protein